MDSLREPPSLHKFSGSGPVPGGQSSAPNLCAQQGSRQTVLTSYTRHNQHRSGGDAVLITSLSSLIALKVDCFLSGYKCLPSFELSKSLAITVHIAPSTDTDRTNFGRENHSLSSHSSPVSLGRAWQLYTHPSSGSKAGEDSLGPG